MTATVVLFNAVSLDGRTNGFQVNQDAYYELVSELAEDATLAGSNTILAATPAQTDTENATTPTKSTAGPLLAVVDSYGRVSNWPYWQTQPFWGNWISLGSERTPQSHLATLKRQGVESFTSGHDHVDLGACLRHLSEEYDTRTIRLESGGALNGAMLAAGLVDEVHLLVHPTIVGLNATSFTGAFNPPAGIDFMLTEQRSMRGGLQLVRYKKT